MFNAHSYIKTLKFQFQSLKFCAAISHFRGSTRKPSISYPVIEFIRNETTVFQSPEASFISHSQIEEKSLPVEKNGVLTNIEVSHPWCEWVDLMGKLLKDGYFDTIGNPFARNEELGHKDANLIRTACLNFARDHNQLIRYLSQEDILVIAGNGCPSIDRKIVNSGKRLRAHVGSNEENVCSSCILRGECDRAYTKVNRSVGGRTVDVMRFLLTYSLDPVVNSVSNKTCLNKTVEVSVRKLLKQMIRVDEHDPKLTGTTASEWKSSSKENVTDMEQNHIHASMKLGNWRCPKCNFLNSARNINCLHCGDLFPERLRNIVEEEHLPLKKGDWICKKCNFLNFARNTRCFQCKEKPPKRHLNPGEWECESCNYINFRRNMMCLKCDHKRPIASNVTGIESQNRSHTTLNHQSHPWFEDNQSCARSRKSLEFVKNDNKNPIIPSLWNKVPGLVDFPVVGGKSEISRDIQKQELWRMEMANKKIGTAVTKREDIDMSSPPVTRKKSHYFTFGGNDDDCDDDDTDDDEMAAWFGGGKKA